MLMGLKIETSKGKTLPSFGEIYNHIFLTNQYKASYRISHDKISNKYNFFSSQFTNILLRKLHVDILKKPIHPIAFAVFPILTLLANNIREVDARVAIRPAIVSVVFVLLLLGLIAPLTKNTQKSALIISLFIILFFSYGQIYQLVKNAEVSNFIIGRHRYLFPFFCLIFLTGTWFVLRKLENVREFTQTLNIIGVGLLIYPTLFLINFSFRTQSGLRKAADANFVGQPLQIPETGEAPDIYYIVLDTYTRADALQRDFDFDNSPFLNELRALGFYVADCSRSNYTFTQGSITAALNLNYVPQLEETLSTLGLQSADLWILMKQSLVRRQLEEIGYTTVAFETGYKWSTITDADIYLAASKIPISFQRTLDPFESMLIDSTAAIILPHGKLQLATMLNSLRSDESYPSGFPYSGYMERQLFILDQLPKIAEIPEPTFTFAHFLIPHVPYIFDPSGEIWSDPEFYSGKLGAPTTEWHQQVGYTSEIEFINRRMLDIVTSLIENSETRPIIIIHGDHGLEGDNRLLILNAYYLSDNTRSELYSRISPVNTFRIIFDNYFGTNHGLLPDVSYYSGELNPRPEISSECLNE